MESFAVATQHSGAINHVHAIHLGQSAAGVAREIRLAITVIVAGWVAVTGIKVLLREDNLGLGAKVGGKSNAETFGLTTLSGIFGRLNGKSEAEVQKKQEDLRDAGLRSYQATRYGFMNFVRGGLLVGDKMEEEGAGEKTAPVKSESEQDEVAKTDGKPCHAPPAQELLVP